MKMASIIVGACIALSGCVSAIHTETAFGEWLDYDLGASRPPPNSYVLDGNEENCLPRPLSECVYRRGNLSLAYHDGLLISKEALGSGLGASSPLIEQLAQAGNRERVLQILREHAQDGEARCYEVDAGVQPCGVLLSENPSQYIEAKFSGNWDLISVSFSVRDAL